MELRVLNYFLTVAREKTISKAAEVLHLSQPTLSKQLKELEQELGVRLFDRGNRGITLTEDGIYLVNRGEEILALVDSTTTNLSRNTVISGQISIGGGETQTFEFVARVLRELREKHKEINIQVYSGNADDVLEKLDKGLLDFGLVIDPVEKQKYEYFRLPLSDQWGLLVNHDNPLIAKRSITPEDIQTIPLLVSSQTLVNNQLAEWLGGNMNNFNLVGTYNLLFNASLLVKEGVACALCIDGIINTTDSSLVFLPLNPPLGANVNVIWKKNHVFSNAAKELLRLLLSTKDN